MKRLFLSLLLLTPLVVVGRQAVSGPPCNSEQLSDCSSTRAWIEAQNPLPTGTLHLYPPKAGDIQVCTGTGGINLTHRGVCDATDMKFGHSNAWLTPSSQPKPTPPPKPREDCYMPNGTMKDRFKLHDGPCTANELKLDGINVSSGGQTVAVGKPHEDCEKYYQRAKDLLAITDKSAGYFSAPESSAYSQLYLACMERNR